MFDFFRKNNKLFTGLLMLLVIPAFVLGGVELYKRSAADGVASVNGRAITQQEWDEAHRQRVQQIRDAQPDMDTSVLDSAYAKYQTLEQLVNEYAVMEWIAKHKMFVSDQRVQQALLEIPQIAALRGENGQIDAKAYADLLRNNGQTPQTFEAVVRGQLSEQQFMQSIGVAAGWQPAVLTEQIVKPLLQQREVQVAMFPAQDYVAKVQPTEAALQAWYQQQAATRYSVPEKVDIEYLVLDPEAVLKRHPHTEKDLAAWYEEKAGNYGTPETRRARHILIAADEKKADAATHAAAKQKAEELLKEVKANPERFSDLAQKHSQDPGSAAKGGDLGFFDRQTMAKPFTDATFALHAGEISGVVQTRFGYHIIRLDDIKPANVPSLQKIRQQVESDFVQERLKQHFASDARLLGEELEKDRTTLKKVAEKMGLPLQTAKGLTAAAQQLAPEQAILTHANVKRALFAAQTLSNSKQASDPITVSPNDLVVLRVTEHVPAHTTPYETIKAQVSADYVQSKAAELAQEAGKAQLQQWLQNPASASFAAPVLVSRVKPGAYSQALVDAAMRADVSKLPALEGADLGQQGYAIVRVLKEAAEAEDVAAALRAQYAPVVQQSLAQAQVQAYLNSIKPLLKVKINVPQPEMPADLAQ